MAGSWAAVGEIGVVPAPVRDSGGIDVGQDHLLARAGAREIGAVGADDAGLAKILQLVFVATAVGVGEEQVVLVRPRQHQGAADERVGRHVGGGHRDQGGALQRQQPHVLRKLDVVADQDAELQPVHLCQGRRTLPRRERIAIEGPEQVRLAVIGEPAPIPVDQLRRVVDASVTAALGITVQ